MSATVSTPATPVAPYHVSKMSIEDGLDIAMWPTPGPWAVEDSLQTPRDDQGYWAVRDAKDLLIGYCCFDEAARPLGLGAKAGMLDVALGLSPTLTGRNLSRDFAATVVERARSVAEGRGLRCAVASWNAVGRHIAESVGFKLSGVHEVKGGSAVMSYFFYQM